MGMECSNGIEKNSKTRMRGKKAAPEGAAALNQPSILQALSRRSIALKPENILLAIPEVEL